VLISPRVQKVGWFDFHRAADSIELGRRATERAFESIEEAIAILAPGYVPLPAAEPEAGSAPAVRNVAT
jgi:NTE family protein